MKLCAGCAPAAGPGCVKTCAHGQTSSEPPPLARPARSYCERRSYDVVRAFERQPLVYWPAWALNHLLSLLGPTSLLRIRPSGPALGPSHPSQDASKGLTVGPHPPPPPPPAALPEGAGSSVESYVAVM